MSGRTKRPCGTPLQMHPLAEGGGGLRATAVDQARGDRQPGRLDVVDGGVHRDPVDGVA
jgi:hypothetical protein